MHQRDSDFLLWIAKRLVYKYRENPDIVNVVENIITKHGLEQSSYQEIFIDIHSEITGIVDRLSSTNNLFMSKINDANKKLEENRVIKINSSFENLNIDELFNVK